MKGKIKIMIEKSWGCSERKWYEKEMKRNLRVTELQLKGACEIEIGMWGFEQQS